jgi:hypothetical protein
MVQPDRPQITIWRMRVACWMTKPIDTLCNTFCFSTATVVTRTRRNTSFVCTNNDGLFLRQSPTRWWHTRVERKVRMFAYSATFYPKQHLSRYERTATRFRRNHHAGSSYTCHCVLSVNAAFSTEIRYSVTQLLAHLWPPGCCFRGLRVQSHLTVQQTAEQLQQFERPPNRPDLAPSDIHLVGPLKKHLGGLQRRRSRGSCLRVVLLANHSILCRRRQSLITCCDQRTNLHGDYVEKQAFVLFSYEKFYFE